MERFAARCSAPGTIRTALTGRNSAGFIEMVHRRGMKIITYTSSCFLQRTDPDFSARSESLEGDNLLVGYWNMARCSPASSRWRAFLLRASPASWDATSWTASTSTAATSRTTDTEAGFSKKAGLLRRLEPKTRCPPLKKRRSTMGAFADLLA